MRMVRIVSGFAAPLISLSLLQLAIAIDYRTQTTSLDIGNLSLVASHTHVVSRDLVDGVQR